MRKLVAVGVAQRPRPRNRLPLPTRMRTGWRAGSAYWHPGVWLPVAVLFSCRTGVKWGHRTRGDSGIQTWTWVRTGGRSSGPGGARTRGSAGRAPALGRRHRDWARATYPAASCRRVSPQNCELGMQTPRQSSAAGPRVAAPCSSSLQGGSAFEVSSNCAAKNGLGWSRWGEPTITP